MVKENLVYLVQHQQNNNNRGEIGKVLVWLDHIQHYVACLYLYMCVFLFLLLFTTGYGLATGGYICVCVFIQFVNMYI